MNSRTPSSKSINGHAMRKALPVYLDCEQAVNMSVGIGQFVHTPTQGLRFKIIVKVA
jgi:hypothetical protein